MMFLSFYGLREQPFGVTPNPRFLYETPLHREALASLVYGIECGSGFTALIAQPGMGKTTLLFHLLEKYRHTARSAFLFDTQCNSHELLQSLLSDLELDTHGNDAELHARFRAFLVTQAQAGRRVLLLIDEAQNLDSKVLETVRLLSNFETAREKLVHIILSGQPQLEAILASPEMLQLRQRITLLTRLSAFTPEETASYIDHRLQIAGYRGGSLFTSNALGIIAAETMGIPREINRICFNALSLACALQKRTIDAELLYEVVKDLRLHDLPSSPARFEDLPATAQREELTSSSREAGASHRPEQIHVSGDRAVRPGADPFAPRDRPMAAPLQRPSQRASKPPTPEPSMPVESHQFASAPAEAADPSSTSFAAALPASVRTASQERVEADEAVVPENTDLAVQRALLDVALKSHQKASHLSLAGVAVIVPLLLWLAAYLIFRLDLAGALRH